MWRSCYWQGCPVIHIVTEEIKQGKNQPLCFQVILRGKDDENEIGLNLNKLTAKGRYIFFLNKKKFS